MHTDNLGGSSVITNASGTIAETLDYYPYGSIRLDEKTSSLNEGKKFTGYINDIDTGLNYANARYQNPNVGNFISEDPVFVGNPKAQTIQDPQELNSYSYARDNPITKTDPTGKFNVGTGAVQKGDTLSAITSQINSIYNTNYSVSGLASANDISNPNVIYAGSTINFSRPSSYTSPSVSIPGLGSVLPTNGGSEFGLSPNLPSQVTVSSSKYGYSQSLPRDFDAMMRDLSDGKLPYRGEYQNRTGSLPEGTTYSEFELPTQEMNLPAGAAGPERLMIDNQSGIPYYSGSHYEGDFLNLMTGETLPGETETPLDFLP